MTLSNHVGQAISRWRDRPCLATPNYEYSYAELQSAARALARLYKARLVGCEPVAIMADHTFLGYAAVVAAIISERPYVPIKPGLPLDRIRTILRASDSKLLVIDPEFAPLSAELLAENPALILCDRIPDGESAGDVAIAGSDIAYIMFTSGSTGAPKGVVLSPRNVLAYLHSAKQLFALRPDDRCTQFFDLSFDLSVHDIVMTISAGACLVVDAQAQRIDPVGFAARAGITVWFSVPSILSMAKRYRRLVPGALPALRLALFCGEALPTVLAQDWLRAAPNARSVNVYGPTEATIAITHYDLPCDETLPPLASVPIGWPYPDAEVAVVDERGEPTREEGELWLGGAQLATGYLHDPAMTGDKFVERCLPGSVGERWYRSGDLVKWSDDHGLLFLGRIDQQVKIRGFRIELAEIEAVARKLHAGGEVAAFTYQARSGDLAIGCALSGQSMIPSQVIEGCRAQLPDYMVPATVFNLDELPLNQNGKVDRNALRARAESATSG